MKNKQIESLVYVCTESLCELKALTAALDDADPQTVDAQLRQVENCANTLSGALDQLSRYMDDLPSSEDSQKGPKVPVDDGGLLLNATQEMMRILDAQSGKDSHQKTTELGE